MDAGFRCNRPGQVMGAAATLPQLWLRRCNDWAAQPALRFKQRGIWCGIGWGEYRALAEAFALALRDAGLQRGDVVALLSENRAELLVADMAIQALGLVSCALDPALPIPQLAAQLGHSRARLLLAGNAAPAALLHQARQHCPGLLAVLSLDGGAAESYVGWLARGTQIARDEPQAFAASIAAGRPDDAAVLCFSRNGRPVWLTQQLLLHHAEAVAPRFDPGDAARSLSILPFAWPTERLFTAVYPLHRGYVVHFPEDAGTILNNLREIEPQLIVAPPRLWEKLRDQTELALQDAIPLAQHAYRRAMYSGGASWLAGYTRRNLRRQLGLAGLRQAISYGAPLAPELVHWYSRLGIELRQAYGMAETAGLSVLLGEAALPGFEVSGADGAEIRLHGPGLPASVASGDLGWRNAQGDLQLVLRDRPGAGTAKMQLEGCIRLSPYIADAVIQESACLILANEEGVAKFAQDQLIPFSDMESLLRHPQVVVLLQAEVARAAAAQEQGNGLAVAKVDVLPPLAAVEAAGWLTPLLRLDHAALARGYRRHAA